MSKLMLRVFLSSVGYGRNRAMGHGNDEKLGFDSGRGPACKYLLCVSGNPIAEAASFESALALENEIHLFAPDGDYTVYEVETGIHFDVLEHHVLSRRDTWAPLEKAEEFLFCTKE